MSTPVKEADKPTEPQDENENLHFSFQNNGVITIRSENKTDEHANY